MIFFKYFMSVLVVFLMFSFKVVNSSVLVDMTAKEVNELRGIIRVRDLIVNDSARIEAAGSLCIKDGLFYIPDNTIVLNGDYSIWNSSLKIKVMPGRKLVVNTMLPNTTDKKKIKRAILVFLSSSLEKVWLINNTPYCNKRVKVDVTGEKIKYLEVDSIDGQNSLRKLYQKLLRDNGLGEVDL